MLKAKVIEILKDAAAAPQGLTIHYFQSRKIKATQRDALLAAEYPRGLKYLVRLELVPSPLQPRQPAYRFFATNIGRTLLKDLETHPRAKPKFPVGRPDGFVSAQARVFETRRRAKQRLAPQRKLKNQLRYEEKMANPAYSRTDYDTPPPEHLADIHPNSEAFARLHFFDKIRILRARKRQQLGD